MFRLWLNKKAKGPSLSDWRSPAGRDALNQFCFFMTARELDLKGNPPDFPLDPHFLWLTHNKKYVQSAVNGAPLLTKPNKIQANQSIFLFFRPCTKTPA
tara:strand:+ start:840 stop:1136 length:297 start_codon:yes stop_codon:yes gene_type:complete